LENDEFLPSIALRLVKIFPCRKASWPRLFFEIFATNAFFRHSVPVVRLL
jgi:hypothetical protein